MSLCAMKRHLAVLAAAIGLGALAPAGRAADFLVTTIADNGFGSLRKAIEDANSNAGPDRIVFSLGVVPTPPVFLNLDTPLPVIVQDVDVIGPGSGVIITQRDPIGMPGSFGIFAASGAINVTISGLSITSGQTVTGAAISATGGTLTVRECLIFENRSSATGGAISVIGAGNCTVNIIDAQIFSNSAATMGGGIFVQRTSGSATVTLDGAFISRNTLMGLDPGNRGGGLYVAGAGPHTVSIVRSTINDNAISTDGQGGGAFIDAGGGSISVVNSTLSGNASGMGSVLAFASATLTINGATITGNNTFASAQGGTLLDLSNAGVTVRNTILSGNIAAGQFRDLAPAQLATGNNNLVGVGGPFVNGVNGNIVGVTNPRLVPLTENGGPTQTFSLQPDSPAIDAASPADAPAQDQRRQNRPSDADNNGVALPDIGAFETQRYLVTNTSDAGAGSLRKAIEDNNLAGGGFVKFAIGTLGQSRTISGTTTLPIIGRTIFVDGWSQGGNSYQGPPLIEIDGASAPSSVGLDIQWSDCIIRGLAVNAFTGQANAVGIKLSGRAALRNWIYGNYVGLGLDGTTNRGNGQLGIWIAPAANVNLIGTNGDGVSDAEERNVISGTNGLNLRTGIFVQSNSNVIAGNFIGTNASGTAAIPNFNGVWIENGTSNRVGAGAFSVNPLGERNVIAGNVNVGISLTSQGGNNSIAGNFVGVNASGTAALPNTLGVFLDNVNLTLVGGTFVGAGNVISGNLQHGVLISGLGATGNLLQGNIIGLSAGGTTAIGNGMHGLVVRNGASGNRIGTFGDNDQTLEPRRRNVFSGNGGRGIVVRDASTQLNRVLGNYIGTDITGQLPRGNALAGVQISGSPSNTVGASGTGSNVIAAQTSMIEGFGVEIVGADATGNVVRNNLIGLAADGTTMLSNTSAAVSISGGASFNQIGGTQAGQGNTIRSNGADGVRVVDNASLANAILRNSIFDSAQLGIDLMDDGVTANGPAGSARIGPNANQNYPVISGVSTSGLVSMSLESESNQTYRIELFSSPTADPTGFGEGLRFLGTINVATNAMGRTGPFTLSVALPGNERFITATATKLSAGSESGFATPPGTPLGTSEFALARAVNTEPTSTNVLASGPEDTLITVQLAAIDSDPGTTIGFRITALPTRGQLLQFGSQDPILSSGTQVTDAQGRVLFRPASNEFGANYAVLTYEANDGELDSSPSTATISVTPIADTPSVTNASTREDVQTTSGLEIARNAADGAEVTHFKISAITNGALFQNDGVTPIASGSFITFAQGNAGLRFTPDANSSATGSFDAQASISESDTGLGGGIATATITVTSVADAPQISGAATREDSPTASGLQITRAGVDGSEVTHFKFESISVAGAMTLPGGASVAVGQFIPAAQAALGLRYAPPLDFFGSVTVTVRASTSDSDAGLGAAGTATIGVTPVNDAPSFNASNPASVLEDAGAQVISNWAAFTSPGPMNESDQVVLGYQVSGVTNSGLFTVPPSVDDSGTLRFTSAPDAFGTAEFTVVAQDSGGVVDGGVDTSAPRVFTIAIAPVNDRPSFTAAALPTVSEDAGPQVVSGWATFSPGPTNESDQTVQQYSVSNVTNPALFASAPTVDSNGVLRFAAAPDAFGSVEFTVVVQDSGGTADGGLDTSLPQTFTISIGVVNDQPSFIAGNPAAVLEDSGTAAIANWATFVPGPTNESDQTALAYTVSGVTNAALFATAPTVDSGGTLRFTPAAHAFGSSQFTVVVQDSGGTVGGGVDTSLAQTFTITVLPVNDAPGFVIFDPPAVLEGQGTLIVPNVARSFTPGPANESAQRVSDYIVDQVSNPALFETLPSISATGTLTYTISSDAIGLSTARVRVRDDGGVANNGVNVSESQTLTIIIRPKALCRNLFIDARRTCVPLTARADQLNATPPDLTPGGAAAIEFSRPLAQPFSFGNTSVVVTLRYADGLVTSCSSIVTVLASDCNENGVPDSCENGAGTLVDCNDDGIADDCQCIWDNGSIAAADADSANGQLSHLGGAAIMGVQTADDFYLAPNQVHRLFSFTGQMFTNSLLRKARLEFYEDCNGRPDGSPIKTYLNTSIQSVAPGPTGFSLVTYKFDFCSDALYLDGGKVYWVVLYGLPDNTGKDVSYWVTTTPGSNPAGVMGSAPLKRFGTPTAQYLQFAYGPWENAAECCAGCVNLAWKISGESCKILHDNGLPVRETAVAGGTPSGADRANPNPPRAADDFLTVPCAASEVCYVDAYVWTNCNPSQGFIELYPANPCGRPQLTPLHTASVSKWIALNQQISVDGQMLSGFKLEFHNPRWLLDAGRNYWISVGVRSGGSVTGRTLFATAASPCDLAATCARTSQWSSGRLLDFFAVPLEWVDVGREHAFRVAVREAIGIGAPPAQPGTPPPCYTDINDDGATNSADIFDFLNAWFTGCP